MSSYHSKFTYLDKSSKDDFGWIIVHFDSDSGETDSYLSQEQIYTGSYNGAKRILYGTKWDSTAVVKITVIKQDCSDFSLSECRDAYRWLTGNPSASWLDLYFGDELQYSFLGTVQDVKPQKLDARTVGMNIYFESISPWAYSPVQTVNCSFGQESTSDSPTVIINNQSDDLYDYIYLNTTITNATSDHMSIKNITLNEETTLDNISINEIITLNSSQFITSDQPNKIFGDTFNFVWPRLGPGTNEFIISGSGTGSVQFQYRYLIKIGDCAMDIEQYDSELDVC